MSRSFLLAAVLCTLCGYAALASNSYSADVTATTTITSRIETLQRTVTNDQLSEATGGSKYYVRQNDAVSNTTTLSTSGPLLSLPGFGWLKSTDFSQKASPNTRVGGVRILFDNPSGAKNPDGLTLVRESAYNAATGKYEGYHQVWRVRLVDTAHTAADQSFNKETKSFSYEINPDDVHLIVDAYRSDLAKATENTIREAVKISCGINCQLDFKDSDLNGLDGDKKITVRSYPDEAGGGRRVALIEWPAMTLVSNFTVHTTDAVDIKKMLAPKTGAQ